MKLIISSLIIAASMAFAGMARAETTIKLPLPTMGSLNGAIPTTCWAHNAPPFAVVSGFSADGNYVLGTADNQAACGHSGRGSTIRYYAYCASFMWDLAGNLVSTVNGACSKPAPKTYTFGAYTAYTVVIYEYGYLLSEYPVLLTP